MLVIRREQMKALQHARWQVYAPRVARFIEDSLGDVWRVKPAAVRRDMVSQILNEGERLGFRRLASVFKFAGLVAGSDGALIANNDVMTYLGKGEEPDRQLERLITSMRVAEVLTTPAP